MIATQRTQSLTDFRQKVTETLDRLNQAGEAEILTVNGEARAVLLSPAAYDELAREAQLTRDVTVMRRAIQQVNEGKGRNADEFFDELRAQLLSMKEAARGGAKWNAARLREALSRHHRACRAGSKFASKCCTSRATLHRQHLA